MRQSSILLSLICIAVISSIKIKTQDGKSTGNFYTMCRCCDGKVGLNCYLDIAKYNKSNSTGMSTTCGTPETRPNITGTVDFDEATGEIDDVHIKPDCPPKEEE